MKRSKHQQTQRKMERFQDKNDKHGDSCLGSIMRAGNEPKMEPVGVYTIFPGTTRSLNPIMLLVQPGSENQSRDIVVMSFRNCHGFRIYITKNWPMRRLTDVQYREWPLGEQWRCIQLWWYIHAVCSLPEGLCRPVMTSSFCTSGCRQCLELLTATAPPTGRVDKVSVKVQQVNWTGVIFDLFNTNVIRKLLDIDRNVLNVWVDLLLSLTAECPFYYFYFSCWCCLQVKTDLLWLQTIHKHQATHKVLQSHFSD